MTTGNSYRNKETLILKDCEYATRLLKPVTILQWNCKGFARRSTDLHLRLERHGRLTILQVQETNCERTKLRGFKSCIFFSIMLARRGRLSQDGPSGVRRGQGAAFCRQGHTTHTARQHEDMQPNLVRSASYNPYGRLQLRLSRCIPGPIGKENSRPTRSWR